MMSVGRILLGLLVATLLLTSAVRAQEANDRYFMAIFAAQPPGVNRPSIAHSFGVFVKEEAAPQAPEGCRPLTAITLSWLPETLRVHPYRLWSQPGRNIGLEESLQLAVANKDRVYLWGPFQIEKELYDRAVAQEALLRSGVVRYRALDLDSGATRISNCVHALSALARCSDERQLARLRWGKPASQEIVRSLRPWIIEPEQTHPWLLTALGVCGVLYRQHPW